MTNSHWKNHGLNTLRDSKCDLTNTDLGDAANDQPNPDKPDFGEW
jgi:hypothetical protein